MKRPVMQITRIVLAALSDMLCLAVALLFVCVGELLPAADDVGKHTLHVHTQPGAFFIEAACARRRLPAETVEAKDGYHIVITCTRAQLEEVRDEFNRRPL